MIAATFFGSVALEHGPGVVLIGLVFHLVNSAVLGAVFALITAKVGSVIFDVLFGLAYGIVVWLVMTYAVLPFVDPVLHGQVVQMSPSTWFVVHLIFGAFLGMVPYFERKFSPEATAFNRATV